MKNLANKIRPNKIEDIIGQKHLLPLFQKVIEHKDTFSFLFYGKPGIGKTSISIILANELKKSFGFFDSTKDSKIDLLTLLNNKEIIIVDEIHRLSKDKQDILLSYLEYNKIIVYATTTENPYFIVNSAVRSRMHILEFKTISSSDIVEGLQKIIKNQKLDIDINKNNLEIIALKSSGDFRMAINIIDLINRFYSGTKITKQIISTIVPSINISSDKSGNYYYDLLSAFHKSLRGSDVDAVLYYAVLLVKGGHISSLYRRMIAFTYEDIGLSNSQMGLKVNSAINAMERLGFPEAYNTLSSILIELALSPKSNSAYKAIKKVIDLVDEGHVYEVPSYLKHFSVKNDNNKKYDYPHDYLNSWVEQQYLPDQIKNVKFYEPKINSNEKKMQNYWKLIKEK